MISKNIAIIGAGPAGITAAYKLTQKGMRVTVFELSDAPGGMAKTIPLWGRLVDLGPHRFFSSDPRVNELWLEAVGDNYEMVNRLTRIYYSGVFFDYPLKAFNALFGLGVLEAIRCTFSYLYSKLAPRKSEQTFEDWVSNRFGYRLYTIFFKSYSEKLWGISCTDLDADFAAQRIKKLSLFEAVKSAIVGSGGDKHKTLVDEFAYPNLGAGEVYSRMAKNIIGLGGEIYYNTPVSGVKIDKSAQSKIGVVLEHGTEPLYFDHVISTMPITALVDKLDAPDKVKQNAKALKFRNTILVYLLVDAKELFPDQWIYVHSADLKTGRITNFNNWVPSLNGDSTGTILCLEYWCYDDDKAWNQSDNALIALAETEAYSTKLIPNQSVKDGRVIRVPKCYPVYERGYRENLKPVEDFLCEISNLSVIGRYGSFKYNNQDHSMLMGILAAENIADGKLHNLWEINTDYEYQESSRITSTGLVK